MNSTQKLFIFLLALGLFGLTYLLGPILAPFLAGIIIAYLGDPLVDRIEKLRIHRTVGVFLVFFGFSCVVGAAVFVIIPMLTRELTNLVIGLPAFFLWLQETVNLELISVLGIESIDLRLDTLASGVHEDWRETSGIISAVLEHVTRSVFSLLGAIGIVGLTPVVAFYMMRDWDEIMGRILRVIPRDMEQAFVRLCRECDEVLGAFLRGQLLIMCLLGLVYAFGLYLVGLELAMLIGMLAGLASIVPYLGFFIGIFAAGVAAMFQFHDPIYLGYIGVVFLAGQALEGWVLTPWLVGDKIGLHPVAVIFSVLAGGQLFGFVGVLLALPLAAVIMVFVRYLYKRYLVSEYYTIRSDDLQENNE